VLDPFMGSGTTAYVAQRLSRKWIGIELNPKYVKIIKERTAQRSLF
jgi:DNA modification methylase